MLTREATQFDYYMNRIAPLTAITMNMFERGMRIDQDELKRQQDAALAKIIENNAIIEREAGFVPNVRSYLEMGDFFRKLGIKFHETETGRPSTAEDAMLDYAQSHPKARAAIVACLEVVGQRTMLSNFLQMAIDEDGFYHPMLAPNGTDTGRMAGKGALEGGPQPQNWPKVTRLLVIPDKPGYSFIQGDLKQAEAMNVAWDAQDPLLMAAFVAGSDVHRVGACVLFRGWKDTFVPPDALLDSIIRVCPDCKATSATVKECNHGERYYAKQIGHATRYMMGPRKLVKEVLPKAGIYITEAEGKRYIDLLISAKIRKWWSDTKAQLDKSPILFNACGRYREFYGELNHDMQRGALAWKASSPISDIVNKAMIELDAELHKYTEFKDVRIVTQTHDSLLTCQPEQQENRVAEIMRACFDHKLDFHGRSLTIPLDIAHGPSWGGLKDM